jgi:hypothetical protein
MMTKLKFLGIILLILNTYALYGQINDYGNNWRTIAKSSNIYYVNSYYLIRNIENYTINNYVGINIPIIKTLKGEIKDVITLRMYMNRENYDFICSLTDNIEILIFLRKSYNPWGPQYGNEYNYYISTYIANSIIVSNDSFLDYVINEVAFQSQIINEQLYKNFIIDNTLNNNIRNIINNITNRRMQQDGFRRLENYGNDGIPYIILFLDDFRQLPIRSISLENNFPGAFEGIRHYGPYLVVDALAAILNQITGESFGSIYNGDDTSDEERRQCINGWYIYLYYLINIQ